MFAVLCGIIIIMPLENVGTFVLSSDALNSHGMRVITSGIDISRFQSNPIMLYNHLRTTSGWFSDNATTDSVLPIGVWKNITRSAGQLTAEAWVDYEDEFAAKIGDKVKSGVIRAVSIGFKALAYSDAPEDKVIGQDAETITKAEILEASLVDIPSNPDALILNSMGQRVELGEKTKGDNIFFINTHYRVENQNSMNEKNLFAAVQEKFKAWFGKEIKDEAEAIELLSSAAKPEGADTAAIEAKFSALLDAKAAEIKLGYEGLVDSLTEQVIALAAQVEELGKAKETATQVQQAVNVQNGKVTELAAKLAAMQAGRSGGQPPVETVAAEKVDLSTEEGQQKAGAMAARSMTEALKIAQGKVKVKMN